jgi:hypothetical protein
MANSLTFDIFMATVGVIHISCDVFSLGYVCWRRDQLDIVGGLWFYGFRALR